MKRPHFTDRHRGRYRTAAESREPGYLEKRFRAIRRLQRLRERRQNVTAIPQRKVANG